MPGKNELNKYPHDSNFNEAECVNKIRSGDSVAFEELFNLYCQQLINFARRYVLDKQIAENIVQDVFVSIWQAVKNNSLKHLRHLKIENKGIDDSPTYIYDDERPDKKLDEKEVELKIHQAINELPEKCREIFKMNRFENLKYAEIAEILDISIKTVETQMGRALKKLRDRLNRI
jgi:RNA polymerase sigma-70 factor (ECF subfamily)